MPDYCKTENFISPVELEKSFTVFPDIFNIILIIDKTHTWMLFEPEVEFIIPVHNSCL